MNVMQSSSDEIISTNEQLSARNHVLGILPWRWLNIPALSRPRLSEGVSVMIIFPQLGRAYGPMDWLLSLGGSPTASLLVGGGCVGGATGGIGISSGCIAATTPTTKAATSSAACYVATIAFVIAFLVERESMRLTTRARVSVGIHVVHQHDAVRHGERRGV